MRIIRLLERWRKDPARLNNIAAWKELPPRQAKTKPLPGTLYPYLSSQLEKQGITSLYIHQLQTWEAIQNGKNVVIITETASGKTLSYNLPVLDALFRDTNKTALYIFPTKALAQDQQQQLQILLGAPGESDQAALHKPPVAIYDADTPASARSKVRNSARIILSNPDMLHYGILPHHTRWLNFFANLTYVVLDEIHTYRGIFGSHVANVLRRLRRIAKFYGADPQFLLTSATIANPVELGSLLIDAPVIAIDKNTSSRGIRNFIIYNPPVIDENLSLRRSALLESTILADEIISAGIQTLIFCRSRRAVELMLRDLQTRMSERTREQPIRGYRSGYLPQQRRAIERSLRTQSIQGVVTTNALELGVDIGELEASVITGYPGSIAATWQQAGRSGRRENPSLTVLVASQNPLDQYLAAHPEYFFTRNPESALINPDNLLILIAHLQCAIYELPFTEAETFGKLTVSETNELLNYLAKNGLVRYHNQKFTWISSIYPASQLSLRNASSDRVLIQENGNTLGEIDLSSAHWMLHPGAIYLHEARSYLVNSLDLEQKLATVTRSEVDYYTEPKMDSTVELVRLCSSEAVTGGWKNVGEVLVTNQVVGYHKVSWFTRESLGQGQLELPPVQLQTQAYWLSISETTVDELRQSGLWNNDAIDYGPSWPQQKDLTRHRDGYRCRLCGRPESGRAHHVHHIKPFRSFVSASDANQLSNLITLCPHCHRRAEIAVKIRSGLAGVGHVLYSLAPLFLMCDAVDLGLHTDPKSPLSDGKPVIVLYERFAAGLGFSAHLAHIHDELLLAAKELVANCQCSDGCPSCVGPGGNGYSGGKMEALEILYALTHR